MARHGRLMIAGLLGQIAQNDFARGIARMHHSLKMPVMNEIKRQGRSQRKRRTACSKHPKEKSANGLHDSGS